MSRIKICKEPECHNTATTAGYCRLHYLKNWKDIKKSGKQRAAKKLNQYIEEVCKKHPENYVDIIKKDIRSPNFEKQVQDTFGFDDEEASQIFNDPSYDEEIVELLRRLKLEKDFE